LYKKGAEKIFDKPVTEKEGLFLFTSFNTKDYPSGKYLMQIYQKKSNKSQFFLDEKLLKIFDREEYKLFWDEIFGKNWDEPIYLDKITFDELWRLFRGSPLDQLLKNFHRKKNNLGLEVTKNIPLVLLRHMENDCGAFPFEIKKIITSVHEDLPHLDLTPFFWLMSALSPVCYNMSFPFKVVDINLASYSDKLLLDYSCIDQRVGFNNFQSLDEKPMLIDIIQNQLGESSCRIVLHKNSLAINWMEILKFF
jgi:hypothetical protein